MGCSSEALKASRVYRNLLRAINKHIGKEEHKTHFSDFIKHEFRNNPSAPQQSDHSLIHQRLKLAHDYTYYLNSVHHHKDLLFSYNIAVDRSDEMRRILGKSAASVGLRLPDVYQP